MKHDTTETERAFAAGEFNSQERAMQFAHKLERERDRALLSAEYWQAEASKQCTLATRAERERDRWKQNFIAFAVVHAGQYGKDHYGKEGCLHFTHYDLMKEAGARMVDFKRCGDPFETKAQ